MIKTITDPVEWDQILVRIGNYDFYHTFIHHKFRKGKDEEPIMFVYENGNDIVAFPFLKRKIENSAHYDLVSVHGKVGPVSNIIASNYDNSHFVKEFSLALNEECIVSIFSKLNPFIKNQKHVLKNFGQIVCTGENMYFNQKQSEEEQLLQYDKSTKQNIRKLKKIAFVRELQDVKEVGFFLEKHNENMNRLGASEEYYFSEDYLKLLMKSNLVNAKIFFAVNKDSDEIMAGKLNIQSNSIVESEIGWTLPKYRKNSPMALLWDTMRLLYRKDNVECINLGGGPGGREGNVMSAKRRFTKNYIDFNVWKLIVDQDKYTELCSKTQLASKDDFFPLYRS